MADKVKNMGKDGRRMQNIISTLFLLYIGVIYPLIMHDKYFDITLTKYKAFQVGVCIYAVLMALAVLADAPFMSSKKSKKNTVKKALCGEEHKGISAFIHRHTVMAADIFMILFFISNVTAFIMADDRLAAYTGEEGRRCGLQFMILALILYICLGRCYRPERYVIPAFLTAGAFTAVYAVLQFAGVDFLNLREGLSESTGRIYISTFGNIDIYASFLCVFIPVAMGTYMMSRDGDEPANSGNKCSINITGAIAMFSVFTGASAVAVTNANLAYAGVGVAALLMFLFALYTGRLDRFTDIMICMACGFLAAGFIWQFTGQNAAQLDGISACVVNTALLAIVLVILVVIRLMIHILQKTGHGIAGKKALLLTAASLCALGVVVAAIAVSRGIIPLKIDDSWGSYRGYVWRRLIQSYREFPLSNKLFGYGNESVKALMTSGYYDEMMDVVGVVYDNAHNEYLQYLVTTGIFGAVTYTGLLVSAAVSMYRCASVSSDNIHRMVCLATALGITGYGVQAVFNLNQSLTTPYIFVLVSMAAGLARSTCHDAR